MTSIVALLLFAGQTQNPVDLMKAYWDRLGKADKLYARIAVSGSQTSNEIDVFLEKPRRMRQVGPRTELRVDGDTLWTIQRRSKQYKVGKAGQFWCDPLLEPFFGTHRFDQPSIVPPESWVPGFDENGAAVPSLLLRSKLDGLEESMLFVDPKTHLPLAQGTRDRAEQTIKKLILNPKTNFEWPSLDGYTQVSKLRKGG